jgi:hypothetical protein
MESSAQKRLFCILDSIICALDVCLLDFYFITSHYLRTRFYKSEIVVKVIHVNYRKLTVIDE